MDSSFNLAKVKDSLVSVTSVSGSPANLVLNLHVYNRSVHINVNNNIKLSVDEMDNLVRYCDYINNIFKRFDYNNIGIDSKEGLKRIPSNSLLNSYCLSNLYKISAKLTQLKNICNHDSKCLSSPEDYQRAYRVLFNKALSVSTYHTIRVTYESFKSPKKGAMNITVPNPLFLNFTDSEQQKLFNVYITPKDSTSTLSNTDTIQ